MNPQRRRHIRRQLVGIAFDTATILLLLTLLYLILNLGAPP